jgi:heptaprenyl diphosphate synthase
MGTDAWSMRTRNLAAAVELLHVATLYHDDIMDGADSRRGLASANSLYGAPIAVLAGDFLLSKAMDLANSAGPQAAGFVIGALRSLCIGQAMEVADSGDVDRSIRGYLASIKGKTADLFGVACALGTVESSMLDSDVQKFKLYGENVGMAFQVADDILDLYGEPEEAGKPVRNDLAEGIYTLPVLEAFQRQPELRDSIPPIITTAYIDFLRIRIVECGALDMAIESVENYANLALSMLPELDYKTPESEILENIPKRIIDVVSRLRLTMAPAESASGE